MIRRPRGGLASRADQQLSTSGAVDFVSGVESTITWNFCWAKRMLTSCLAAALVVLVGPFWVAAEELTVHVGFNRSFKVGQWTPIIVDGVAPSARDCEVIVIDPDGVRIAQPLLQQTANSTSRWSGVFRSGRLDGDVEIRVWADGPEPIQHRKLLPKRLGSDTEISKANICVPLRQSQPVWLEVGTAKDTELLTAVESLLAAKSEHWPDAAEIPWALDGIDGIWVTSTTTLTDSARVELERWLRRGGHLIVTIATNPEEFQRTPWSGLLSELVEARDRTRTSDLSGIESYAVHAHKILGQKFTAVTTLKPKEGRVLVSCLDGPLATRANFGYGLVTVLGVDLAVKPLSLWNGRVPFIKRLTLLVTEKETAKSAVRSALSQSGITDLASQWRAAVIHMPDVARPTLWGALGLLLAYSAVIGPLDYLLVHKLLKRPHWTWGTLPLLVAVARVGSVWLAYAVNGDTAKLTQLDVVDIDAGRQEVTARSWVTTYSTENRVWKIEAKPARLNHNHSQTTLSWLGFPENSSGGLYRESGFDLGRAVAHSAADRSSLDGVPFSQWSSKSLTAETMWVSETPLVESQLTSTSASELGGRIVHHLPFELHDWIVVYEKWVYRPHPKLGEAATKWPADQPWTPGDERNYGRELRGFLTRTTATKRLAKKGSAQEDVLVEQERYNPLNLEPSEILQMLTLHEAAGGKGYTGLDHHSLRAFDLSPLLSLDRAVVIARIAEPTTEWRFNGTARAPTRHHGFVRFVLPVKRIGDPSKFRDLPKFEPAPVAPQEPAPASKDTPPNETKSP
ncbi:MAG: hypothetical protein IAG10_25520 [Planctomycetaceae bacterium]|nr:hypothetical protein [Planctomycetaceae bacterium]